MTQTQVPKNPDELTTGGIFEIISIVLQALIIAVVIRTFLFQPFTIPSGSMRPTLLVGDYLFVSKFSYGYSKYSLPFSPDLFSGRIWGSEPKRGDVLVFRLPSDPSIDYIKRVVGLPGDRIQVTDGVLYINDKAVERTKVGETIDVDMIGDMPRTNRLFDPKLDQPVIVYREKMDNGVEYNTFDLGLYPGDNTNVYTVSPGHYFMMGDNRDNSEDSRFSVRQVPYENLIGRANIIFFSIGNGASAWQLWKWPFDARWSRMFSFVQTIKDVPTGQK
ncbi:signal peptidase I [Bartonella sp. HY329]|uniref:signal peptidase I n=1 Tax=unclassified Bartonella TaxID=2645622 RepID=UPI0021C90F98|nr:MULTISPECIES: signal peptidase I [unclassified Bartonella]UXM95976.1 signal peptidase I [Bartonella sp. HY329]UXN10301.1 signal peptidase I [Bartonella sp. HY328]